MAKKSGAQAPSTSPVASEPMSDKERQIKYQTEDDLRSLTRAQEIMDDPARLKRVRELADEQSDELEKVVSELSKRGLISDKERAKMKKEEKDEADD